jgi:hypothetical protein
VELLEDRLVPSTVYWTGAQDSNWDNPVNWSSGSVPAAGDDVVINQTGANVFLYNYSGTPDTIRSLSVQASNVSLSLQLGTLDISGGGSGEKGDLQANQSGDSVVLAGGTLANADVTAGTVLTVSTSFYGSAGTLDGVGLDGTLDMASNFFAGATVLNGLTLTGEIELGAFSSLNFGNWGDTSGQNLAGTGTLLCSGDFYGESISNNSTGVLTIGPGITIQADRYTNIYGAIDNQGSILENVPGGFLTIGFSFNPTTWTNDGIITAAAGTSLRLYGNWTNDPAGSITAGAGSSVTLGSPIDVDPTDPSAASYTWINNGNLSISSGSSVNLGGVVTATTLASLGLDSSDTVSLFGTLDNRGSTLTIGGMSPSWSLQGGRIYEGIIATVAGSALQVAGYYYATGTLDGVELDGTLDMTQGYVINVTVLNGLTVNGEIDVGGFDNPYKSAELDFGNDGDTAFQSLLGTGTIVLGGDYSGDTLFNHSAGALLIGPGITIEGGRNSLIAGAIDNQGLIDESLPGGTLSRGGLFSTIAWTNEGRIDAATGTTLNLHGSWANNPSGVISVEPGATVSLGSSVNIDPTDPSAPLYTYSNLGTVSIGPGCTVNLGGVFTVASLTSLGLDDSDVYNLIGTLDNRGATLTVGNSWTLAGGRIYQGTITTAPGSSLAASGYGITSTLDGVQLDGTLQLTDFSTVQVLNSLVLHGEIDVGGSAASLNLGNYGDATAPSLTGSGQIVFGLGEFTDTVANLCTGVFTIGPGITIEAGLNSSIVGPIDNQSVMTETVSGGTLSIGSVPWTNEGFINAASGTTLNLYGQWTNNTTGTITVGTGSTVTLGSPVNIDPTDPSASGYAWSNLGSMSIGSGSTVNLGGVVTTSSLPSLGLDTSDSFNLVGTLDNRDATLGVGGTSASWSLAGGRIYRGVVAIASGSTLVVTSNYFSTSTLDGVAIDGTVDATQGYLFALNILNGLTLNGELDMGPRTPSYSYYGTNINFGNYGDTAAQDVSGNGRIVFGDDFSNALNNYSSGILTIGSGIAIDCGQSYYMTVYGGIDNQGIIDDSAPGGMLFIGNPFYNTAWTNEGTIRTSNGAAGFFYGIANNSGLMEAGAGGSIFLNSPYIALSWTNTGTISADGGSMYVNSLGQATNYDSTTSTLSGGTWQASNGGNLQLSNSPVLINDAAIVVSGAGSQVTVDGTTNALSGMSTNALGGSLAISNGASIASSTAVNNLGTLSVGQGSSFSAAGYSQSGGLSVIDGTLSSPSVTLNAGVLRGTGAIQGDLNNAAEIDPGDSPGTLSITGNYTQGAAGVLNVEIGGTSAGSFDQLAVSGTATLAGTLNVHYVNGFIADPGNPFPVLTFGTRNGDFAVENGLNPVNGQFLIPAYDPADLTLVAKDATTAAITSSVNPSIFGQPVTVTATIHSSGPGAGTPTGSVTFMDGATVLGNASLSNAGVASITVSSLSAGSHTIAASYGGDSAFLAASSSLGQTVRKDSTTTAGSAPASPANFGQALTFTAIVSANAPGSGTPSGSVDFYDSTTQTDLGAVVLSGGRAQLTTTMLPTGSQSIVMSYGGDPNFLASNTTVAVSVRESIYLLNSAASGALTVSGNATINTAGLLQVDSNSSTAVQASGYANVTASSILVVGGVHTTDHAVFHPTPVTGSPYVADPFAALAAPTGGTNRGSVNLSGNSTLTINPGTYSQISVSGNAVLTMTPGVYVIAGGGLTISVNGRVTGNGVIIYNAGSNYPGSGGSFGAITMSGSSTLTLTAASTGAYAGICVFQSRDNTRTISLGGNAIVRLNGGLLYAPQATLSLSVNAQIRHNPLILGQLQISGNGISTPSNALTSATSAVDQVFSHLPTQAGASKTLTQTGTGFGAGKIQQPATPYLPVFGRPSTESHTITHPSKQETVLGDLSVALLTDLLDRASD